MTTQSRIRVLLAKAGLDGHDRGALVVARALRDSGCEVIYTGRRKQPEEIAAMAIQEDVDVVGLSLLSGAHLELARQTIEALTARGGEDIAVVVGGTVLKSEEPTLRKMGVAATFPTGTTMAECVTGIQDVVTGGEAA